MPGLIVIGVTLVLFASCLAAFATSHHDVGLTLASLAGAGFIIGRGGCSSSTCGYAASKSVGTQNIPTRSDRNPAASDARKGPSRLPGWAFHRTVYGRWCASWRFSAALAPARADSASASFFATSLLGVGLVLLSLALADQVVTAGHGADGLLGLALDVLDDALDAFFRASVLLLGHASFHYWRDRSLPIFLSVRPFRAAREPPRALHGVPARPHRQTRDQSASPGWRGYPARS